MAKKISDIPEDEAEEELDLEYDEELDEELDEEFGEEFDEELNGETSGQPEEEEEQKTGRVSAPGGRLRRKRTMRFFRALIAAILTVGIVFAAVMAVVYRDWFNLDTIERLLAYRNYDVDETGQAEEIFYDNNDGNCFAQVDNSLMVCSTLTLQMFSADGSEYFNTEVAMDNPTVCASGSYAIAYDTGGTNIYGIAGKALAYAGTADGSIITARINSNGYLTVISQEAGYKGVVTLYDGRFNKKVQEKLSSHYVMDAIASEDGKTMVIVTIGENGENFASMIGFYDTSTGELKGEEYILDDQLVLDMFWDGSGLILQTDTGMCYVTQSGGIVHSWENENSYIRAYTYNSNAGEVMIWGSYQNGYQGEIVVVNRNGERTARASVAKEVYSASTAGNYIALLFTNELDIYTTDLKLYATLDGTAGSRQVVMREDGTALLIGTESATLYVP